MRLVWTPWASRWDWLRLKWLMYRVRAFSSSSVNSPSSSAPLDGGLPCLDQDPGLFVLAQV